MNIERAINKNLVYLADNITNITKILLHLQQEEIILQHEAEEIESEKTRLEQNSKLLRVLKRKDLALQKFIEILGSTGNDHCVNKIAETQILSGKESSMKNETLKRKQTILKNIWWPQKKFLTKSLYERKIGDKLLIEELHEIMSRNENKSIVICESEVASKLTGLGGIGKTLTANWYAHVYEKDYDQVIWIDCGEGSLLTSFKKLARDLDIQHLDKLMDLEDYSRKSYEALEDFQCLWVFDNAENYRGDEGIKDVLPKYKENFYCLITSRSREWGTQNIGYGNIVHFELNIFSEIESICFFKENLISEIEFTEYQLKQLCLLLGNLPLAMQLAVAALNRRIIDLQDYIEKTSAKDLGNIVDTKFDDYEKTISGSVQITLELIAKEGGNLAKGILNILGYIRPDEVDFLFLSNVFNYSSGFNRDAIILELKKAIELLTTYSLITRVQTIGGYGQTITLLSIHRLLQQVIRHHGIMMEKETLREIFRCNEFFDYKLLPFTKYADKELQMEFPKVKAELIDQRQLERLLKEKRFEEAVQLAKFVDEELSTTTTKFNYALCLEKNGQLAEARKFLQNLPKEEMEEGNGIYSFRMGVLELEGTVAKELFDGFLLIVYWRTGNRRIVQEILLKTNKFVIIKSHVSWNAMLEILSSNLVDSNYVLECGNSTIDFQLDGNIKEIKMSMFSLELSFVPSTVQKLTLTKTKVVLSGGIDLPNLKYLKLVEMSPLCLSLFSSVQINEIEVEFFYSPLDLSIVPCSVQKLFLKKTNVTNSGIIDLPNLKYLKLEEMSPNCLSLFSSVHLDDIEMQFLNSPLDLSIVPSSIHKLSVRSIKIVVLSGEIDLPNLKYLKLGRISSSFLPLCISVQLTRIDFCFSIGELNVDNLPPSVKYVKLCNPSSCIKIKVVSTSGARDLNQLILEDFTMEGVEEILKHFHPIQLVIVWNKSCYKLSVISLIELMRKQVQTIAIGKVDFGEDNFEKSFISKHVDRFADYYLLEGVTGKALEEEDFEKLCELSCTT